MIFIQMKLMICKSCYGLNWKDHAKSNLDRVTSFIESIALDAIGDDDC